MRQRTLVAPIALLTVLAAMSVFLAITNLATLRQSRQWVNHSHQVIETTQALFNEVLSVESGQRGYLLAQNEQYLDSFKAGQAALPKLMGRLRALVADDPQQKRRADRLIAMASQRVAISAMRVALARQGRLEDARKVAFLKGKLSMDATRAAVGELMAAENTQLDRRAAEADRAEQLSLLVALLVSALAIAGLAASLISMAAANRRLAHEVGEREDAEAAQRESEALYRALFANNADYLFVIDISPDGVFKIAELNPAFERASGITTAMARGRDIRELGSRSVAAKLIAHYESVITAGAPVFARDVYPLPAGQRTWETIHVPVRGEDGRIDRIVGSGRDVTDRDQAEDQLRRAQRMEAIGHLTGGVAHDFNNLLQVIRGNLEMIAPDVADRAQAAQRLRNALHGADRAAQLTRQLLAFARRQPLEPKVVNLGRMAGEMSDMLRRMLGESITVETVIADGLWNTLADPAQVESALLNLAINARDAMPGGGRLGIEVANASLDQDHALRDNDVEPGQYVLIAVSDTGHGMSSDVAARVFEPFFTTKSEEKGTGLGLSMVYGFVKQSNGHVQLHSEVGQGTTVKIFLPRAHHEETVSEPVAPGSLEGRSEVILVVEDDDLVRVSSVGMLRDLGYTCLHASDGAEALELLRAGIKVDLLFTDVVMPGPIRGPDLAAAAQRLKPGLPVLFTSGYTEDAIVHDGRLDTGVQLLSKPFSREDLARRIHGLLSRARPVVLVVEDDALVRLAAVDMIGALGFTALQAGDATGALRILEGETRVDILFTDVGLPGMRGPELAEAALAQRPDLKIIFASGYADTTTVSIEGAVRLGKPYQQDELAEVLGLATD
ncbi:MAG TPA: CHASE3 domain-containing protein [Caulobacteraceae bacterium]|jgi:PAS domain S-box-containing protein|nr:CHASE3 domain-containing protein [Caulobacteraceae bacterium]